MKRFSWSCLLAFVVGFVVAHARARAETGSFTQLLQPYYLQGCLVTHSSSTVANVSAGSWMDSTNTSIVTSFPATTMDTTVVGAGGIDQKVISQTGSSTLVAITASADITGNFNKATLSGTMSSSGTTLTGTSTKFLTEVATNDLIGNSTRGYSRVTAINSDTSITLAAAFPASAASGDTMSVYYTPTIWIGSTAADKRRIDSISSDGKTTVTVDHSPGDITSLGAGQTLTIGVLPNLTNLGTGNLWLHAWVRQGSSGTTATWSTQRKTPYSIGGYTTAVRRVAAVPTVGGQVGSNLAVCYQQQSGNNLTRSTFYQDSPANGNCTIINLTTITASWVSYSLGAVVPPTSTLVFLGCNNASSTIATYVRPRNIGSTAVTRPFGWQSSGWNEWKCQTDGAQAIDIVASSGTPSILLQVGGYVEDLTQ